MRTRLTRFWPAAAWAVLAGTLLMLRVAAAVPLPGPVVETDWLANNLKNVVILDVRANEDSFTEKPKRGIGGIQACGGGGGGGGATGVSGHIPDSIWVPWDRVRAARQEGGVKLMGMLPDKSTFQRWVARWGVNSDSTVIVTSAGQHPSEVLKATRLYWSLKYFGFNNVAVLNGGTAKWAAEGRDIDYGRTHAHRGNYAAGPEHNNLLATTADVQKAIGGDGTQLVDVRGQDVYLGLTYNKKFVQPGAMGHIPGAKSFPLTLFVNSMGPAATFYPPDKLKAVASLLGVDPSKPTIVYCDSGGQASLGWFVFHALLGNDNVRLYDGSMNEWSSDKSRPVVAMKFE